MEAKKEKLNESLRLIGISPVKTHGLAKSTKINVACGKLEQSFEKQKEIVADIFDMENIGGTVKRKITRASLQRPLHNQILSFNAVENFCTMIIQGITFFTISKEGMVTVREQLASRYKLGSTVPGTRNCHHFEPISTTAIQGKHLSIDNLFPVFHSFSMLPEYEHDQIISSLKRMDYVTCEYNSFWWLALIDDLNVDEKDVTCKFMHPHGPTNNFYWPLCDDKAYVPYNKIIMKVKTPNTSSNGRQYNISEEELHKTIEVLCVKSEIYLDYVSHLIIITKSFFHQN